MDNTTNLGPNFLWIKRNNPDNNNAVMPTNM